MEKRKICESCGHVHMCAPPVKENTKSSPFFSGAALAKPPPHYLGNPAKQSYFNYLVKTPLGNHNNKGAEFKHGGNGKDTNISFKPQPKIDEPVAVPPEALPKEAIIKSQPQSPAQPHTELENEKRMAAESEKYFENRDNRDEQDDGRMVEESELEKELISEFNRDPGRRPPRHLPVEPQSNELEQPSIQQSQEQNGEKKKKKWTSYKNWRSPE